LKTQKVEGALPKKSLWKSRYEMKVKTKFAEDGTMNFKNVNPNGEIVVTRNIDFIDFFF
jgi:hypothetical protein